jgi:hypothetical protein
MFQQKELVVKLNKLVLAVGLVGLVGCSTYHRHDGYSHSHDSHEHDHVKKGSRYAASVTAGPDKGVEVDGPSVVDGKKVQLDGNLYWVGGPRAGASERDMYPLVLFETPGESAEIVGFKVFSKGTSELIAREQSISYAKKLNTKTRLAVVNGRDEPLDGDAGICDPTLYTGSWAQWNGQFNVNITHGGTDRAGNSRYLLTYSKPISHTQTILAAAVEMVEVGEKDWPRTTKRFWKKGATIVSSVEESDSSRFGGSDKDSRFNVREKKVHYKRLKVRDVLRGVGVKTYLYILEDQDFGILEQSNGVLRRVELRGFCFV